jgi:ABC-type bacteriocin/lantibiotic exporter with double-glycine peptidase domain
MSLLKSADRIIVMAGGRVVLDGARDMVLQKMGVVK